ncbi:MAG: hypothetical protein JNL21_28375 [Myxococcales bacterium]|nr:hypothetical protein [Myxococcales bacterium]
MLLLALVGCAAHSSSSKPPSTTTATRAADAPANQSTPVDWLEAVARHAPSLADKLRECDAGECEAEAFSWCERDGWSGDACSFRHPREGSIYVTRKDQRLSWVSITVSRDPAALFETLAKVPSVVFRDGRERLHLAIGPKAYLVAWPSGNVELFKVTPLSDLPELLGGMRSEGNVQRMLRPTRLHVGRDDFGFFSYREQRGTTTWEAGYTCIPVSEPGDDEAVMGALARHWGKGRDETIQVLGAELGARLFENGWVAVDLRTYPGLRRTSQMILFYGSPSTALSELGPHCDPDEDRPEQPAP